MSVEAEFVKMDGMSIVLRFWGTKGNLVTVVLPRSDIDRTLADQVEFMKRNIGEFTSNGSGWILVEITKLYFELYKYVPPRGCTYHLTPKRLVVRNAVINLNNDGNKSMEEVREIARSFEIEFTPKTSKKDLVGMVSDINPTLLEDQKCFLWAVLSWFYPPNDNADRSTKYKHENSLITEGLEYPVKTNQVQGFASKNNLIINVYEWKEERGERGELSILHMDNFLYRKNEWSVVNLVLYKGHSMWFKRMCASMYKQTDQTDGGKHLCLRCLHHFSSERTLNNHIK